MEKRRVSAQVFPPGHFLREEMEARGWTQKDLADILQRPVQVVNEILLGKKSITPETAKAFDAAFGVSAEYWLGLENIYRLNRAKEEPESTARRAKIFSRVPVRELVKRNWMDETKNLEYMEKQVCEFLEIKSIDEDPPCNFAARKSGGYGPVTTGQRAWYYRCRRLARAMRVLSTYGEGRFREAIGQLRGLSLTEGGISSLPESLSRLGIRLVFLEHLPGTKIDGAAFWLDDRSPVVAVSLRFDRIDSLWHTLFHEFAHVIREDSDLDVNLIGSSSGDANCRPKEEQEADRDACGWLVPQAELAGYIDCHRPFYSRQSIVDFGRSAGVHPGIVLGQLQHRGEIPYSHNRSLLIKVRHLLPMER